MGLLVDEWGVWDRMRPEEEKNYGRLWQQITMRSAVAAALGLNVFHRQADKLVMCNIAQIVNVLHVAAADRRRELRAHARPTTRSTCSSRTATKTAVKVETGDADPLGCRCRLRNRARRWC